MKKVLSLVLSVLCMVSLIGCQSSSSSTTSSKTSTATNNEVLEPFNTSGTIEETVLVDEQGIKITATSLDYESSAAVIHLNIENNSAMTIEVFSNDYKSVNGYMTTSGFLWTEDIDPQSSLEDEVRLSYSELEIFGIREIADVTMELTVEDEEEYDYIYSGIVSLETSLKEDHDYTKDYYPTAINNSTIQSEYDYSILDFSDEKIFDKSDVSIISTAIMKNKDDQTTIFLETSNDSGSNVGIKIEDVYLNDILVCEGSYSYNSILAGKKEILDLSLSDLLEYTEEDVSDIGKIKSAKFTVLLVDDTTGSTLYSEEITLDLPNLTVNYDKDE